MPDQKGRLVRKLTRIPVAQFRGSEPVGRWKSKRMTAHRHAVDIMNHLPVRAIHHNGQMQPLAELIESNHCRAGEDLDIFDARPLHPQVQHPSLRICQ